MERRYTIDAEFYDGSDRYQRKHVRCGKSNCKKCPHGPYWYVHLQTKYGKPVWRYIGKKLPVDIEERWINLCADRERKIKYGKTEQNP